MVICFFFLNPYLFYIWTGYIFSFSNVILVLILWEFHACMHAMYFYQLQLVLLPITSSMFTAYILTSSQLPVLFVITQWIHFVLFKKLWVLEHLLEHGWPSRWHTLKENWLLFPGNHKLSIEHQFRIGALDPLPFYAEISTGLCRWSFPVPAAASK